jgi:hypothetical protein
VHTFLKKQTQLHLQPPSDDRQSLMADAEAMGLLEGLHGHARAARLRLDAGAACAAQPARPLDSDKIKFALPKGRMQDNVLELMREAGLAVELKGRVLRPRIKALPDWDTKMLKPRNVVEMLDHGARHVGFVGFDLITGEMMIFLFFSFPTLSPERAQRDQCGERV